MSATLNDNSEITQWTLDHKTTEPFIFRSGGFFGFGKKAWSIRSAVKYMDRHPEDGIYHLENGTLAIWLAEQHGEALADLARGAARNRGIDARAMLETFLIGTGLVRRPRLALKPRRLGPVYILAGQKAELSLRIRKGRGRGHLFGVLQADDYRVRIDPARFGGDKTDVVVTLDTVNLPISAKIQETKISILSSASDDPIAVPIRYKVVGKPAPFERWILRPFLGFLFAGLIGAALGALFGKSGVSLPPQARQVAALSPAGGWAVLMGVFWGILGGLRGAFQPQPWPVGYALRRCLVRLLTWFVTLGASVAILRYAWLQTSGLNAFPWGLSEVGVYLAALGLAIIPAAIGEIWNERTTREATLVQSRQPLIRRGVLILLVALSGLLAIGALRKGDVIIKSFQDIRATAAAQGWGEKRLQEVENAVNDWTDKAMILYFDHRAPSHTPTPTTDETIIPDS